MVWGTTLPGDPRWGGVGVTSLRNGREPPQQAPPPKVMSMMRSLLVGGLAVWILGGGAIGYLHIRATNAPSLRQFTPDLAMNRTKKALVIDQRSMGVAASTRSY